MVALSQKGFILLSGLMRMKRLVFHKHEMVTSNEGFTSMKRVDVLNGLILMRAMIILYKMGWLLKIWIPWL
jgi:hypothetical protein